MPAEAIFWIGVGVFVWLVVVGVLVFAYYSDREWFTAELQALGVNIDG